MSDECKSEWERRKAFIRNGFPMPHCGGKRYTMPDDIAEELKVRAAIEQVEGTVFERAAVEIERLRAERDEVRQSYCSLMEAYRGGDGRVTANKLGWGYLFEEGIGISVLFPRRPKKEDGK